MEVQYARGQGHSDVTAIFNFVVGAWLFVSPWVYGAGGNATAWNSWIVGGMIALFAIIRYSTAGARALAWFNMALGVWVFISPWIYGYTVNTGRFINSLCAGAAVILLSAYAASREHTPIAGTPAR